MVQVSTSGLTERSQDRGRAQRCKREGIMGKLMFLRPIGSKAQVVKLALSRREDMSSIVTEEDKERMIQNLAGCHTRSQKFGGIFS